MERSCFRLVARCSVACAVLLLGACASGPDVFTNQDPAADFSNYRTYDFEAKLGTDRDSGSRSLLSTYLTRAVARELEARGYTRSDTPDLKVNFYVNTEEKVRSRSVPTAGGYYGYRAPYYDPWGGYGGYETQIDQFTEGTLNVDLIDAAKNQLVWEGAVVGKITEEVRQNVEATVNAATAELFKAYPYVAGSNVPQATGGQ